MTTKQHREIYNKNLLHPWGDLSELGNDESSSVIVKGKGIHIFVRESTLFDVSSL